MSKDLSARRDFLLVSGAAATSLLAVPLIALAADADKEKAKTAEGDKGKEEEVSPAEDLMREHGVLKRILLVYGEAIVRIDQKAELSPDPIMDAAKMVRAFVEDYHEKLEEDFLFPRFRKANKLVDLVEVLLQQHQGGRKLTDITIQFSTNQALKNPEDCRTLCDSMRQFIRMYNPYYMREYMVFF